MVVYFNTERVVSAGTTKTYRIDASVSNPTTGASVTTKLLDDFGLLVTTNTIDDALLPLEQVLTLPTSSASRQLGGRPFFGRRSTESLPATDWTNGVYVKTLPTISQTLSL